MIKVGVTGGIGSGKTTVCEVFSILGVPIYNADQRAKAIVHENAVVRTEIIDAFGKDSYVDGLYNRDYIAKKVFNNQDNLTILNGIVHPQVALDYQSWLKDHAEHVYTIKEAALLIESKSYMELDHVINVVSPVELRIKRIRSRDTFRTVEEIQSIIDKQLSDDKRDAHSDIRILNDDVQLIIPQVIEINNQILSKASTQG